MKDALRRKKRQSSRSSPPSNVFARFLRTSVLLNTEVLSNAINVSINYDKINLRCDVVCILHFGPHQLSRREYVYTYPWCSLVRVLFGYGHTPFASHRHQSTTVATTQIIDDVVSFTSRQHPMSSAFKRVISNPEELGNTSKRMSMGENAEDKLSERLADANLLAQTEDEAKLPASPPAIVECDDQIENTDDVANDIVEGGAGETVLQFHASSSTTSSSLSDRSAENQEGDDEKDADAGNPPATVGIRRNQGNLLNRSDSKVSTDSIASSARSGTSGHGGSGSGNWGWFEDVHGADGAENKKKKKSSKKGVLFDDNGSSGLLSRVIDISHPSVDNGKLTACDESRDFAP